MAPRYVTKLLAPHEYLIDMDPGTYPPRVVAGWHVLSREDSRSVASIYRLTTGRTLRI